MKLSSYMSFVTNGHSVRQLQHMTGKEHSIEFKICQALLHFYIHSIATESPRLQICYVWKTITKGVHSINTTECPEVSPLNIPCKAMNDSIPFSSPHYLKFKAM